MNRYLAVITLVLLFFGSTSQAFAKGAMDTSEPVYYSNVAESVDVEPVYFEFLPTMTLALAADSDVEVPTHIRNNKYFLESVRLTDLANQSYEEGDYDASYEYSEEAIRYASLSDEYVLLQLKIKECDDAIAAARRRLDSAVSMNAATRYPADYNRALSAFSEARDFRAAERWDDAIAAANRVLVALASVTGEGETAPVPSALVPESRPVSLPAQYTVRAWSLSSDCLWNIAGRPWVYNDPWQWKVLYEANRTRMPQPDNPDLINPGMILNIPSIRGEERQGMWDANTTYPSFTR